MILKPIIYSHINNICGAKVRKIIIGWLFLKLKNIKRVVIV